MAQRIMLLGYGTMTSTYDGLPSNGLRVSYPWGKDNSRSGKHSSKSPAFKNAPAGAVGCTHCWPAQIAIGDCVPLFCGASVLNLVVVTILGACHTEHIKVHTGASHAE
jgi:hypothetical protein